MLYKKNSEKKLSPELFRNPTAEFRGTPFWAWNTDLDRNELLRQIEVFKKMGLGGFHMHVRTGMSTVYLSDEFMALIKACTEKAKEENMLAWLYDEDRWPSGAAGGYVTEDERFRARNLLVTKEPQDEEAQGEFNSDSRSDGCINGKKRLLACYDIVLTDEGRLSEYKRIDPQSQARGAKWYVYLVIHSGSTWYNNRCYVDTLNKKAIERFIEITHEKYRQTVGDEFDKTVPAIFTDEPQFTRKDRFENSLTADRCTLPWTDDFPDTFKETYGIDIFEYLPELLWEGKENTISKVRYFYHDHICERFTGAFSDTIGKWCEKNGIHLTGHMMEEPSLRSQTCAVGEAMRAYRSFGLPGIDMLCASFEFTTAKQTQSAKNQFGREGMLSELYGVTGWDYDFRGYKLHGDWQTCLGVSIRVPHLSWVAMGGEAKRDYPASISYQSPWWEEYSYIEDHFARVNALMTRGKPVVNIGVIHPIESYWLHFGPHDLTGEIRAEMDSRFKSLTEWLLKGSIDFDFISESLLPQLCPEASNPLNVGKMSYDVIIVPGCESLRGTTLERLEQFRAKGGRLIFLGEAPTVSDGGLSDRGLKLYEQSEHILYEKESVLGALEENRLVKITRDGALTDSFIYRLMSDGDGKNMFISRACEPADKNSDALDGIEICVKGIYYPAVFDTQTGAIFRADFEHRDGRTVIRAALGSYDSLLLRLSDFEGEYEFTGQSAAKPGRVLAARNAASAEYKLSENNVYLIDICEFALDGGEMRPEEEILRLDNICRKEAGLNLRGGHVAQPWTLAPEVPVHSITLRKVIESEIDYSGALLAVEKPEKCRITFNGVTVDTAVNGWYTDKDIKTVPLPEIRKGENVLVVTLPLGNSTNTEWMYILGAFGVRCEGHRAVITSLPEKLAFGDIVPQGLPFYGGNITYLIEAEQTGKACVYVPEYYGGLVKVRTAGGEAAIIYPPYRAYIDTKAGETMEITLFGNRANCFGPVHRTVSNGWIGPDAWRTEGDKWSYDYCLKHIGITKPLSITYYEENT